jgi:hypothetical protein
MRRKVEDGERLSGHGDPVAVSGYPEIHIIREGALMFTIESFHWCEVRLVGNGVELIFEGSTAVLINGEVYYATPDLKVI